MDLFIQRLRDRHAQGGANPLITYYDERSGERTELSAQSFWNWVEKTANLLGDELLAEEGRPVLLTLADEAPAHWVTLIWVAASWRYGCPVAFGDYADAAVEVVGPATLDTDSGAAERVACSLHPFGLGFSTTLPAGVVDFGVEVRAHGDHFAGPLPDPQSPAWLDGHGERNHTDVAAEEPIDARIMLVPDPAAGAWPIIRDALVRPVLGGGSSVIVLGAGPARRAEIAGAERATTRIS